MRNLTKLRESEVVLNIMEKDTDERFIRGYLMLENMKFKTYDEIKGKPEEIALFQWLNLLEGVGLLMKRGVISLSTVDDYVHGVVRQVWIAAEPVVVSYREKYGNPELGEWAEYLYLTIYGKSKGQVQRATELQKKLYFHRLK